MKRDLRERIGEALDALPDRKIRELLEGALTAEKTVWVTVTCKKKDCGHTARYPIDVPNWHDRAKVLDILATQAKGKPAESLRIDLDVRAKPLEELTLAELEAEERRLLTANPELEAKLDHAPPRRHRKATG